MPCGKSVVRKIYWQVGLVECIALSYGRQSETNLILYTWIVVKGADIKKDWP